MIVASGTWVYADEVARPVDVIGLGHDFWFELGRADGELGPDEAPTPPDADGLLYYVRFRHAGCPVEETWPDSVGHDTVEAAKHAAQARVPGPITWRTQVASAS